MSDNRNRYQFGPRSQRGLVAGWQASQLLLVGAGLVSAVAILRSLPDATGAVLAFVTGSGAVSVARWPVAGRTLLEWLPAVSSWAARRSHPARISERPFAGVPGAANRRRGGASSRRRGVPSAFGALEVVAVPARAGRPRLGAVRDGRLGTFTAVVMLEAAGAMLGDLEGRARRCDAWSGVLASLAAETGELHRVQWISRRVPSKLSPAAGSRTGRAGGRTGADPSASRPAMLASRSYEALLRACQQSSWEHQTLIAVTVSQRNSNRARQKAPRRVHGGRELVSDRVAGLCAELDRAGLSPCWPLGPDALSETILQAFCTSSEVRARSGPSVRVPGRDTAAIPWPIASEHRWSSLRTGGAWHATYWVAEWPRSDVGPEFLAPLLFWRGGRITMSMTMQPVPALRAAREAEQSRTAELAESELSRRHGFLLSARRRKEASQTARLAAELAEGHAQFNFSAYVGVTSDSAEDLESDCHGVERAAAQAGLDLRRLYGQIDRGLACMLPLGRGLS